MEDFWIVSDRDVGLKSSGGVHHIAALVENPSVYKIHKRTEIPNSSGCYRAKIYKNGVEMHSSHPDGKSFFPDSWDEYKVIDAIKGAWGNKERDDGNAFIGTYNGLEIRMFIQNEGTSTERIISAFPN